MNAQASTGPKTARVRALVARNALRHALALSINSNPALSEEADALACEIAGTDPQPEIRELARRIAEAQIDLRRVRRVRYQLLSEALIDPDYESEAMQRKKLRAVIRYSRVFSPTTPISDDAVEFLRSKPEGPHKFATILSDKARQLLALDRYERRALSRRKFAFRAFDVKDTAPEEELKRRPINRPTSLADRYGGIYLDTGTSRCMPGFDRCAPAPWRGHTTSRFHLDTLPRFACILTAQY